MRRKAFLINYFFILVAVCPGFGINSPEAIILNTINQERMACGLDTLLLNYDEMNSCEKHAVYISKNYKYYFNKDSALNTELVNLPWYTSEGNNIARKSMVVFGIEYSNVKELFFTVHYRLSLLNPCSRSISIGYNNENGFPVIVLYILNMYDFVQLNKPILYPYSQQWGVPVKNSSLYLKENTNIADSITEGVFPITTSFYLKANDRINLVASKTTISGSGIKYEFNYMVLSEKIGEELKRVTLVLIPKRSYKRYTNYNLNIVYSLNNKRYKIESRFYTF